jgi:hypothetical protein
VGQLSEAMKRRLGPLPTEADAAGADAGEEQAAKKPRLEEGEASAPTAVAE